MQQAASLPDDCLPPLSRGAACCWSYIPAALACSWCRCSPSWAWTGSAAGSSTVAGCRCPPCCRPATPHWPWPRPAAWHRRRRRWSCGCPHPCPCWCWRWQCWRSRPSSPAPPPLPAASGHHEAAAVSAGLLCLQPLVRPEEEHGSTTSQPATSLAISSTQGMHILV